MKEFRHLLRNRRVLAIAILMPIVVMFLVGYTFNGDIRHVPIAIVDEDNTHTSRALTDAFNRTATFRADYTGLRNQSQAENLIRDGKVQAALVIPKGFATDVTTGRGSIVIIVDGSEPVVADLARQTAETIAEKFAPSGGLSVTSLVLYNPDLHYMSFLAPSILGLIILFLPSILMATSLAGEKERGTIEQLVVTPVKPSEVLLGKMIVYVFIGVVEGLVALIVAEAWFGLTVRGSVGLVVAFLLLFTVTSISFGTLSSVFAKNQVQAIHQLTPIIYISIFLSGVFYPLESMPRFLQPVAYLIPLTYMNEALRAIIIRGAGFGAVEQDFVTLGIYTAVLLVLAFAFFKKTLD